jgi:phenylpropionate dioxygenase-like ring-hydroxylating dioxygenase large terminal subunit
VHGRSGAARSAPRPSGRCVGFEEALEKGAVLRHRDAQILGRDIFLPIPASLEISSRLRKLRRKLLHQIGDEVISLLDRFARLIDELPLSLNPLVAEPVGFSGWEERGRGRVVQSEVCGSAVGR